MTNKKTENGRLYFGDKDAKYLEKMSREAVETHHNIPILYFEIDWSLSKRNFYGEILLKKFKTIRGIDVKGVYNIEQNAQTLPNGVPNKSMKMTVSIYTEQFKELNISPALGDYFGIGKRLYQIVDKTVEDVGPGNLLMNRGRMRQDFICVQDDDEVLLKNAYGDNLGFEVDINPENSII